MIVFGVASIPQREKNLKIALESILPQADKVHVYLNNYKTVPSFLLQEKIVVYRSQEHGDRSDGGKFFNVPENCYYLTIDDDLVYHSTHADLLISKLKEYDGAVIVSLHGRILKPTPIRSYYRDKLIAHRCLRSEPNDRFVHTGGTGVMAIDTRYFRPKAADFKMPHMADIWVGILAQQQKIPILALAHPSGYVKAQEGITDTIHRRFIHNDRNQTAVCNNIKWVIYKMEKQ